MYIEGFEQWTKLNKNLNLPVNELNKTLTEISGRISAHNLAVIEGNVARFSSQIKRLSNVRKPEDFLNLQRECLGENLNAGVEIAQKTMQLVMENMEDLSRAWGSTAAVVTEKAVEKAQKFAEKAEKAEKAAAR